MDESILIALSSAPIARQNTTSRAVFAFLRTRPQRHKRQCMGLVEPGK